MISRLLMKVAGTTSHWDLWKIFMHQSCSPPERKGSWDVYPSNLLAFWPGSRKPLASLKQWMSRECGQNIDQQSYYNWPIQIISGVLLLIFSTVTTLVQANVNSLLKHCSCFLIGFLACILPPHQIPTKLPKWFFQSMIPIISSLLCQKFRDYRTESSFLTDFKAFYMIFCPTISDLIPSVKLVDYPVTHSVLIRLVSTFVLLFLLLILLFPVDHLLTTQV